MCIYCLLLIDDDEKQMSIETAFKKVVVKKSPKKVVNKKSPVKTCSVSDFFGATPVHRVERKLTSVKRKAVSINKLKTFSVC